MKTHYIPAINEREFNRMAKVCDPVLIARRERAVMTEIVNRRNALLRERYNLRTKPRRTLDEDKRMSELDVEIKELMGKIGRKVK